MTRILLVETEPQLLQALGFILRMRHYDVCTTPDASQALVQATTWHPDLVILDIDLDLSGGDGSELIARLRERTRMPIIVVGGHSRCHDEVAALDAGADDYITGPFGIDELLAHVRAVLRRAADDARPAVVEVGDLRVDLARKVVTGPHDERVHLTPIEWGILEPLLRNPGILVGGEQLLTAVWGPGHTADRHYLRIYLSSLRRKLEPNPSRPRYLITAPGMGYRFEP